MNKRPNIIIINPDEMRWDTMGHMGNPAASTPRLDRFARDEAVSFSHAYCQNPVCVPSRCSFLTGLYPHVNGHRTMHNLLREGEHTLFAELRKEGYHVVMNARNDFITGDIPGLMAGQFDEIILPEKKSGKPELIRGFPYSHFAGVSQDASSDTEDIQKACEVIRRQKDSEKPLCLFIGLANPHVPYVTDQAHYGRIDPDKIRPRVRMAETEGKSKMIRKLGEYAGLADFGEKRWKEVQRIYLAQCSYVDDLFGMVVDALKEAGIYEDSAVFFLSDHGDFAGDFDLPEKAQNSFEDVLTRVPLLVKPPGKERADPGISASLAELVDFYATVMDYAGVSCGHDQFGLSLRPVIENRAAELRTHVFCEGGRRPEEKQADEYHYFGPEGPDPSHAYWAKMQAEADDEAHAKGTMIFDGRYKYILRLTGEDELYDLKEDPLERINRIGKKEYESLVSGLRTRMLKWYQETCDAVPRRYGARKLTEESLKRL